MPVSEQGRRAINRTTRRSVLCGVAAIAATMIPTVGASAFVAEDTAGDRLSVLTAERGRLKVLYKAAAEEEEAIRAAWGSRLVPVLFDERGVSLGIWFRKIGEPITRQAIERVAKSELALIEIFVAIEDERLSLPTRGREATGYVKRTTQRDAQLAWYDDRFARCLDNAESSGLIAVTARLDELADQITEVDRAIYETSVSSAA